MCHPGYPRFCTLDIKSGTWTRDGLVFNQRKLHEQSNPPDVSCPQTLSNQKVLNLMVENPLWEGEVQGTPSKDSSVELRCILSNTGLLLQFSRTFHSWKHWVKCDSKAAVMDSCYLTSLNILILNKHQWKKVICVSCLCKNSLPLPWWVCSIFSFYPAMQVLPSRMPTITCSLCL